MRTRLVALAALLGIVMASPSQAGHHLWDVTEAYSNADGTVQFIELFTADANEQGVGPFTVTASGHTFNFVTSLPTSATANTWILIATQGYANSSGAVTPDYIIPSNFLSTGGGTINYASGVDVWNYGALPTDGLHSLLRNGSTATNSPTNFAGRTGTIHAGTAVPMLPAWGLIVLVGTLLLVASGLLRRRESMTIA